MTTYLKEDFLYDDDLLLEDSLDSAGEVSAIIAAQAGKVLNVEQVIDLGDGLVEGYMIVDVDAITQTSDELYVIKVQGTNVAAFATAASVYDLAMVELGAGEVLTNATATTGDIGAAGDRFVVPFRNEQNGTVYRYVRAYLDNTNNDESITATIWMSLKR